MPDRFGNPEFAPMLQFHTMDVFTDTPFSGNPLAVVLGADDLTTAQMQRLAREFNLSETIFVQRPTDPAHSARVRIFFPTAEIPFAGHPTIGCAILLAEAQVDDTSDFDVRIILEEEAGIVPVSVWRRDSVTTAELTAPVVPFAATPPDPEAALDPLLLAAALDLNPENIGFDGHRPGVWQGGPAFLYLPVANLDALGAARPIEPHWSQLMRLAGIDSAYLYAPGRGADYQARMFSPTAGIPEDPATGSASAILAAQLQAAGALHPVETRLKLMQGVEMCRPSHINLTVVRRNDDIAEVRVSGSAVAISSGRIVLPS